MAMAHFVRNIITNTINRIGENHLRQVHNRAALSSLKEHDSNEPLAKGEKEAIQTLWGQMGYKGSGEWHRLYKTVNGFDARYVPNDVYGLELLPRLNATKLLAAWDDKSYYPRLFPEIKQPDAIAFAIDGRFYDCHYRAVNADYLTRLIICDYDKIVMKPSDGMEGRGVELIEVNSFDFASLKEKLLCFGRNYVIQAVIEQHSSLAIYNRSSVNPIRVMTLRLGDEIHYLHSTLRFGSPGSHTDMNFVDGKEIAHVCAIDSKGEVSPVWFDMDGKKDLISNLGIARQEVVPSFDRIIETAISVHEGLHHFDLIGCDITLNKQEEPVLIEYNVYWPGIIIPQYCHGPLFGDLTEELIFHLKRKPKK